jgi:hypothetical protein
LNQRPPFEQQSLLEGFYTLVRLYLCIEHLLA